MATATEQEDSSAIARGFQLNELSVDPRAGEVKGPAGREQLDPKVMGVLVVLAEGAGQVVSREQLLGRVWPGTVVSDDALSRCLYELRRHLGQAGGNETYRALIETLPKRGYRLNATVSPLPQVSATQSGGRRVRPGWVAGIVALLAALAAAAWFVGTRPEPVATPPRIAVLPFVDLSETGDQGYLADGFTEEITDRLARSEGLKVKARTSAFAFRGEQLDIPAIARKLDVTHVVEGSIRTVDQRIRVTAQLIAVSDGAHLWSETFERKLEDVFAIQDEIAVAVAAELEAKLVGLKARRSPASVEALVLHAQGDYFYNRRAPGDVERAVRAYEEVVRIDPRHARAWASLAGAYSLFADEGGESVQAWRDRQGAAARRAVELDPDLGVAHFRLAQYLHVIGKAGDARQHWREFTRLDPGNPLSLHAQARRALDRGDVAAALAFQRQAVAADPLALTTRQYYAELLSVDGQYEAALEELRRVRENDAGPNPTFDADIVRVLVLLERYPEAETTIRGMPEGKSRDFAMALMYMAPGMRAEAEAALDRLARWPIPDAIYQRIEDRLRLADAYAIRNRTDDALEVLENARREIQELDDIDARTLGHLLHVARLSPLLKPLYGDPRWTAFAAYPE